MDIYFQKAYAKLHETIENGVADSFEVKTEAGKITHQFIKREIPFHVEGDKYSDLITPYGYGGPMIEWKDDATEEQKHSLIRRFEADYSKWCKENNIVSEFIRFHPLYDYAKYFSEYFNIQNIRQVIATPIDSNKETFEKEFSKSTRKVVRKSLKAGVSYRVTQNPESIDAFLKVYYSTMDRNNAADFYYFDKTYFEKCLAEFQDHILLIEVLFEDQVIAAGFYFISEDKIYAHLSGTDTSYLNLSPAYIIKYATIKWAEEHHIQLVYYGGGTTSSPNDSLYQFKRKFSRELTFDFYIGRRIHDKLIYQKLCQLTGTNEEKAFFPAYRRI